MEFGMIQALMSLHPDAQWRFEEENYESLEWLSEDIEKPTQKAIEDEIARLNQQAELDRAAAEQAAIAKQVAIESAKAKLAKLGLTAEEAAAVIGL
jgi:hypothetical protein